MRCTNYGASYFSTKWDPSSLPCQSRLARTRMASGLADRQVVGGWRGQSSRSVGQKEDLDDCGNRGVRLAVVVEKRTGGCVCGETAARREDESKEGRASAAAGSGAEACPKQQAARQAGGRAAQCGSGVRAESRVAPSTRGRRACQHARVAERAPNGRDPSHGHRSWSRTLCSAQPPPPPPPPPRYRRKCPLQQPLCRPPPLTSARGQCESARRAGDSRWPPAAVSAVASCAHHRRVLHVRPNGRATLARLGAQGWVSRVLRARLHAEAAAAGGKGCAAWVVQGVMWVSWCWVRGGGADERGGAGLRGRPAAASETAGETALDTARHAAASAGGRAAAAGGRRQIRQEGAPAASQTRHWSGQLRGAGTQV